MKDAGTGQLTGKQNRNNSRAARAAVIAFEKQQAAYFGYRPLGWYIKLMPTKTLRAYMEARYNEQPEGAKRRFGRAVIRQTNNNKKRIRKMIKK